MSSISDVSSLIRIMFSVECAIRADDRVESAKVDLRVNTVTKIVNGRRTPESRGIQFVANVYTRHLGVFTAVIAIKDSEIVDVDGSSTIFRRLTALRNKVVDQIDAKAVQLASEQRLREREVHGHV